MNGSANAEPSKQHQLRAEGTGFNSLDRGAEGNRTPDLFPLSGTVVPSGDVDAAVQSSTQVVLYLAWLTDVRRLQPSSIRSIRDTITAFVAVHPDLSVASTEDIEEFMRRPRWRGEPPKAATMARERHSIRGFYRWLHARGFVSVDPSLEVGAPTVRNRHPKAIDDDVWKELWSSRMPAEDRVWLGLGFYAGLRRIEYATMSPLNVHLRTERLIDLVRKGGSTFPVEYGQMARVFTRHSPSLLSDAREWLDVVEWLTEQREGERFLMPSSLGRSTEVDSGWFNKRLKTLLGQAGLPRDSFAPHALRHSCATNLLRCGVPIELIADLLSHSSLDTTRRYLDTSGRLAAWASD